MECFYDNHTNTTSSIRTSRNQILRRKDKIPQLHPNFRQKSSWKDKIPQPPGRHSLNCCMQVHISQKRRRRLSSSCRPKAHHAPPAISGAEDNDDLIDNYEMLTGNEDHYTLSEKMVHHCGGAILPVHWIHARLS